MRIKIVKIRVILYAAIVVFAFGIQESFAENKTWYIGEGLKPGDYFSYELCHVDYKDCSEFQIELWIEGTITVGIEEKWLAKVIVIDENKIVKGNMELGKFISEPTGGASDLGPYRGAFKSSVTMLAAYGNVESGRGFDFGAMVFPIGHTGIKSIQPIGIETITVPAGTFETNVMSWKAGNAESKIWIVDDFPFPIKGNAWTYVSEGIAPQEFKFELLDYQENLTDPFLPPKFLVPANEDMGIQELTPQVRKQMMINLSPEFKTPKQQMKVGILPSEVECKEGLELIFKYSDGSPACVTPKTAEKLIERGWAESQSKTELNEVKDCNEFGITDTTCFVDSFNKSKPAKISHTSTTIEGDHVSVIATILPEKNSEQCIIEVLHDTTQDEWGERGIFKYFCYDLKLSDRLRLLSCEDESKDGLDYQFAIPKSSLINTFEECVDAGNPVMESYPRQCRTPDGKHFVEEIVSSDECFIDSDCTIETPICLRQKYTIADMAFSKYVCFSEEEGNKIRDEKFQSCLVSKEKSYQDALEKDGKIFDIGNPKKPHKANLNGAFVQFLPYLVNNLNLDVKQVMKEEYQLDIIRMGGTDNVVIVSMPTRNEVEAFCTLELDNRIMTARSNVDWSPIE